MDKKLLQNKSRMINDAMAKNPEVVKGTFTFDRHEIRAVDEEEIVDMEVILDGKRMGTTKIVGTLANDVIGRNLKWMTCPLPCTCGSVNMAKVQRILVNRADKVIRLHTTEGINDARQEVYYEIVANLEVNFYRFNDVEKHEAQKLIDRWRKAWHV